MKAPSPLPRVVDARFVAAAASDGSLPPPVTVEVAFAGRSNVGKSTLLNALMGRKGLARTSSTPGCTRQIVFYEARLAHGLTMHFVDLPGYGYARRSKSERDQWATLIEGYLLGRPTLRAVVTLVDVRRGLEAEETDLLELLRSPPRTSRAPLGLLAVATKLDKVPPSRRKLELQRLQASSKIRAIGFHPGDPELAGAVLRALLGAAGLADFLPGGESAESAEGTEAAEGAEGAEAPDAAAAPEATPAS